MSRSGFGPVALAGVVSAGVAAFAASRPWYDTGVGSSLPGMPGTDTSGTYPAASALSLVLLAAWGVLLVTRRRVRRGFAVLALLGALCLVAAVVAGGLGRPADAPLTSWFWTCAVVAVVAVVPAALAVRLAPRWPEMGSRYDAPAARGLPAREEPLEERDLWRSLDAGQDPTDPGRPSA